MVVPKVCGGRKARGGGGECTETSQRGTAPQDLAETLLARYVAARLQAHLPRSPGALLVLEYLLYWYKSTNTARYVTTRLQAHLPRSPGVLLVQEYLLYWYKSTNNDTWGAAYQGDPRKPTGGDTVIMEGCRRPAPLEILTDVKGTRRTRRSRVFFLRSNHFFF